MEPNLARYAELRTPRYTSYPTAPQFGPGVSGETVAGWLAALDPATPLSLYLHVPFCKEMCWYCACNMKLASRPEPVLAYADSLEAEVALVADRLPGRMRVVSLHWGGGTPTAMPMDRLARVMDAVRARFDLAAGVEIAFELDPRTFQPDMAPGLAALGTTRASLGVQEFDGAVQAAVNRVQPYAQVAATVAALRGAGVAAINFDLIYGLPHQSVATLTRTVDLAAELSPDRIALFGYAHVPWMAKNQRLLPEGALPGPAERFAQAEAAAERLEGHGYIRIGLDHFARPGDAMAQAAATGRLRRNFQGYTVDDGAALIGFGATSISTLPQGYTQNFSETRAWARAVATGLPPVHRGVVLAGEDVMRRALIERLMCDLTVDVDAIARAHGRDAGHFAPELARAQALAGDGIVAVTGSRLTVPGAVRPALRVVAALFDQYAEGAAGERRHAVAV